jgi:hypothetical protein
MLYGGGKKYDNKGITGRRNENHRSIRLVRVERSDLFRYDMHRKAVSFVLATTRINHGRSIDVYI